MTAASVIALLSTAAVAYTLQNTGFSVTSYASGYTIDGSGHGPLQSAWEGNVLWAVDAADAGVYKADAGLVGPSSLTALTATKVNSSPIGGGLNGLAVGLDGRLYATLTSAQKVVELSKTDGSIIRTLTVFPAFTNPASVATDPLTGDLIVTSSSRVWRITDPAGAATPSIYATLSSGAGTKAIAIGPDGTMFVVNDAGQLWTIESTALAATHPGSPNAQGFGTPVPGMVGIAVVTNGVSTAPQFVMVSTDAGAVYRVPVAGGDMLLVLDTAGAGQQISSGPDRCAYASMGAEILRIADAAGGCALALAGVTSPALSLDANVSGQPAHAGDGAQTVRVNLTHAAAPAGHDITFTITGVNRLTFHATTDGGGGATISYVSAVAGLDTIVATAVVDGFPLTSNAATINWLPAIDMSVPTIAFSYTVPPDGLGTPFSCDTSITSDTRAQVSCAWFTRAPTLHFTLTSHGTSGLAPTTSCDDFTLNYQPGPEGHHQTCTVQNGDHAAQATFTVILNAILTPPTITAAATVNTVPYTASTPTRGPVLVHFTCASAIDTARTSGIASCPADQPFAATGTFTAPGTTTDVAGQTASASFGPFQIDATPPVITPLATSGGHAYAFGSWTNADVTIAFVCTDNLAVATCPARQTVIATTAGVTVTATDTVGNTATLTTGAINIDRTPPATIAMVTGELASPNVYLFTANVALAATDGGSGVAFITYQVDGGAPVVVTAAMASFAVNTQGSHTITYHATDALGNVEPDRSTTFAIIFRQHTALAIISSPFLASGASVSARLLTDTGTPVVGESVTFSAGGVARTAMTDASGVASVDLGLAPGAYRLSAAYGGTTSFFPSDATAQPLVIYATTRFLVWAPNATIGASVQFFGADWSKQISDKDARKDFGDFKGFAATATGTTWTGRPGDKVKPPTVLPRYIAVLLTTSASKTKDVLTGNVVGIAIIRVDSSDEKGKKPYDGKLGDRGVGIVLAVVPAG